MYLKIKNSITIQAIQEFLQQIAVKIPVCAWHTTNLHKRINILSCNLNSK